MSAGKQSRDLNQVLSENQGKVLNKRTRLHTRDIVFWLRKRFLNKNPNMNYLFFPEELQKHYEVDKIFKKFDEDGSGKLDFNEFYDMLVATGINIDIEDLREFYKRADEDHDLAFDFKEFKNCTLSEEANYHFANMMNKVRKAYEEQERNQILEADEEDAESSPKESPEKKDHEDGEEEHEHEGEGKKKIKRKPYLPRTFGNLLNYITYTNRKRELTDFLNDDSLRRSDRFGTFKELIDLKIGRDVYLAKYYERFKFLERTETATHRSKQDLNDLASAINSIRRSTLSSTVAGSANRVATEEDDIHKEIEALERQGKSDGLEQFEKRKLRLLRFKSSSPTTVRSEIKTSTPRTNRVVVKKIEQKSSSFKGLQNIHAKNFANATDGFKVLKIPNLNLKNPSLIPENAGRLLSSSSRDNNTQPNLFKDKRTNSLANQTDGKISLIKLQNLQNQDTSTTQNSKSPINTFARYIKEVKTEPDVAIPQEEKKLVKNYLRYAENPKNSSPLPKAELHLEGNEAMSIPSESSVSFQDLAKRRKFQASFGIPVTKVSKMPSFYNNYSSTFDNYVTTPDTLASTRLTTTPTDGIYPSPRTMKMTSSPLRAHALDLKTPSSAGTFFKSSLPPSRSINLYQVSRKNSENKNVMPTGGSLISVTGNKVNKNVKSKSVRLIMTGLPEVKREKKL